MTGGNQLPRLRFGTSGVRALVTELTDHVVYRFGCSFGRFLTSRHAPRDVFVGGDLRQSTPRIMGALAVGLEDEGYNVVNCGFVPTPALYSYAVSRGRASVMVTGSHIPADRNGIKFNTPDGELLRADEAEIVRAFEELSGDPRRSIDASGAFAGGPCSPGPATDGAAREYVERYARFFGPDALGGARIVVHQHSSVARDLLPEILELLGADVATRGRTATFVAVDTEAVDDDPRYAEWIASHGADALVSTDGDADRPLLVDGHGSQVRGDVLGILVADALSAHTVVTSVNCNSAVELCGKFEKVERVKIGSPEVVAAMARAVERGDQRVVGYEANGGFLTATELVGAGGRTLAALASRDSVLPLVAVLHAAHSRGVSVAELAASLPARYTASGLVRQVTAERAAALIASFEGDGRARSTALFSEAVGPVTSVSFIDGVRITFESGEVVHLRPSGNAPEFRCYSEAGSAVRAQHLVEIGLELTPF